MKTPIKVILLVLIASCSADQKDKFDLSQNYTVEGYIISKNTGAPVINRTVAISQQSMVYNHSDPRTITDTSGYFKLTYTPTGKKEGLNIYPVYDSYECIFTDISFIGNIPKGQNVNLKKIYTSNF